MDIIVLVLEIFKYISKPQNISQDIFQLALQSALSFFSESSAESFALERDNSSLFFVIWSMYIIGIIFLISFSAVFVQGKNKKNFSINKWGQLSPLKIFICYSSQDGLHAKKLYKKLLLNKFSPWLDQEKILPGQNWKFEIVREIEKSDVVLVLLSKQSVNRAGYMQREIGIALDIAANQPEGRIFIIPVRLDECEVPNRLRELHWANLFDLNGYQKLQQSLEQRYLSLG